MNFCEYFKADPSKVSDGKARGAASSAKNAFDNLFGG
jgi:hypothetical protein